MKILLYEATTAGELSKLNGLSQSILCEGYAMSAALAADLAVAGHEVTVLATREHGLRILFGGVKAKYVEACGNPRKVLRRELPSHDAAYVIAPESGGMLAELIEMTEEAYGSKGSLNPPSSAVRRASDKLQVYRALTRTGIAVPRSLALNLPDLGGFVEESSALGFPLVLKPLDGAGCEGLTVAFDEKDLAASVREQSEHEASSIVIAQEYVRGVPASVSLLCSKNDPQPLSLNRQVLLLDRRLAHSLYLGGVVPLDHAARRRAFQAACGAVETLSLNRGYVGVDVILARDGPVIVDVNPRLTTSYIGLRKTASVNVAEWIIRACLADELPPQVLHQGYAVFLKVPTGAETGYVMVEGHGATLMKAVASFRRARSTLIPPGDTR